MPNSKPNHLKTGNKGEQTASHFLSQKGWNLITSNFRIPEGEIDLIFLDQNKTLHFIEVKTRTSDFGGPPETWVDLKKQIRLTKTAHAFLAQNPDLDFTDLSFDIIAIILKNNQATLKLISPAFDPPEIDQT